MTTLPLIQLRALPRFDLLGAQQVSIVVVVIGMLVGALFVGSFVSFARERTVWRSVQLFGSFCLVVVVLTHVAEAFGLLPGMGWGLPNTPVITLISAAPSLA
jgi:hypothetical protein